MARRPGSAIELKSASQRKERSIARLEMDRAALSIRNIVPSIACAETNPRRSIRRYLVEAGRPLSLCDLGQEQNSPLSEVLRVATYSFFCTTDRVAAAAAALHRQAPIVHTRGSLAAGGTHHCNRTRTERPRREARSAAAYGGTLPNLGREGRRAENSIARSQDCPFASEKSIRPWNLSSLEATAFRRLPLNQVKDGRNGLTVTEFIRATHSEVLTKELRYPKYSIGVATLQLARIVGAVEVSFGLAD